MKWVVDASVAVKWILREPDLEPDLPTALALLGTVGEGQVALIQPAHWLVEVMAVVGRARPDFAPEALRLLAALELPLADEPAILERGLEMAIELRHHLFDTLYHAVALERGASLVTADDAYFRKAYRLGGIVRLAEWRQ
jgi:predicted nucleic acid-binding protein